MRKSLILFILIFALVGCRGRKSLTPTSSPPPPTIMPTKAASYYPAAEESVKISLIRQLADTIFPQRYYDDEKRYVARAVSTGKTESMHVAQWEIDVLWIYEINASVVLYPLILGVWDGKTYTPYLSPNYGETIPTEREAYLRFLDENKLTERGRLIYPLVQGDFVSRAGIDWEKCGDSAFCQVGKYMEDTYGLDQSVTAGIVGVNYPIPEGWALAWSWIPATEKNTLPGEDKVELPQEVSDEN